MDDRTYDSYVSAMDCSSRLPCDDCGDMLDDHDDCPCHSCKDLGRACGDCPSQSWFDEMYPIVFRRVHIEAI